MADRPERAGQKFCEEWREEHGWWPAYTMTFLPTKIRIAGRRNGKSDATLSGVFHVIYRPISPKTLSRNRLARLYSEVGHHGT